MALSLAQKLRIKEGMQLLTLHAPNGFAAALGDLPAGVKISKGTAAGESGKGGAVSKGSKYDQMHWFVKDKAQLVKEVDQVLALLKPGVLCWIYYPKGTSKIQTDLTRDHGWESLMKHKELQWVSLISFDDTWSAFGMRQATDEDKAKTAKAAQSSGTAKRAERPILDYIDPKTKTVHIPDELEKAFKKNKAARQTFDALAYSHRKEYVEWIVTAKREETRTERVTGTIERLVKGWKNPRNL